MADKKLTDKQTLFIHEYLSNGFNATQAAKSAGYSSDTAFTIGCENLKKPYIREEIDRVLDTILANKKEKTVQLREEYEKLAYDTDDIGYMNKLRAMEGIARYLGLNKETVIVDDKLDKLFDKFDEI